MMNNMNILLSSQLYANTTYTIAPAFSLRFKIPTVSFLCSSYFSLGPTYLWNFNLWNFTLVERIASNCKALLKLMATSESWNVRDIQEIVFLTFF
jgi:hypothetical protein